MQSVLTLLRQSLFYISVFAPFFGVFRYLRISEFHYDGFKTTLRHEIAFWLMFIYLAVLFCMTLAPQNSTFANSSVNLVPLHSVVSSIRVAVVSKKFTSLVFLLGNFLLLMPLAVFIRLLWRLGTKSAVRICFLASVAIELIQLFEPRSTDIDDVIFNTLSAWLGSYIYTCFARRFPRTSRAFRTASRSPLTRRRAKTPPSDSNR